MASLTVSSARGLASGAIGAHFFHIITTLLAIDATPALRHICARFAINLDRKQILLRILAPLIWVVCALTLSWHSSRSNRTAGTRRLTNVQIHSFCILLVIMLGVLANIARGAYRDPSDRKLPCRTIVARTVFALGTASSVLARRAGGAGLSASTVCTGI